MIYTTSRVSCAAVLLVSGTVALAPRPWGTHSNGGWTGGRQARQSPTASCAVMRTVRVGQSPVAVAGSAGHAFVANQRSGSVSLLASRTGTLLRTIRVGPAPEVIAVDEQTRRVFVGALDTVSVLDASTGANARTVPLATGARFVTADERNNHVLVIDRTGNIVTMLDGHNGRVLHTELAGWESSSLAVDTRTQRVFIPSGTAHSGWIGVVDAHSGALLHNIDLDGPDRPALVVVDELTRRAFVTVPSGSNVVVADTMTMRTVRSVATPLGPRVIAVDRRRGHVFVATYGPVREQTKDPGGAASAYMLDATTGARLAMVTVGEDPQAIAVDERAGRVLIANRGARDNQNQATRPGSVTVLDANSARVLCTITVGKNPTAVAVDTHAGRAFVVNTDDNTVSILDTTHL